MTPDPISERGRIKQYRIGGNAVVPPSLPSGLYVVATPIGNLRDVTIRALEMLAAADLIACEDTRVTRKLADHYGITTRLTRYDDHNAATAIPNILGAIGAGAAVALVSDAGTPLVSDPGYQLVRAAREAGYAVSGAPGASALLLALTIAGLPTDRCLFDGFLPAKSGQRRARIAELAPMPATLVLFETGPRLAAALSDLATALGPRQAAVCRELTKVHEEVRRGDLVSLAHLYAQQPEPRGEIVLVVAPPETPSGPLASESIDALLREALGRRSLKDAVAEVAAISGCPRRDVYQRALAVKQGVDNSPP